VTPPVRVLWRRGATLAALLVGILGGDGVDTAAVAAALPDQTSGSAIRENVGRAVLGLGRVSRIESC